MDVHPDLSYCRSRLKEPSVSCASVAKATGLSKRWVEYVRDGTVDNPGIKNLMTLKAHLESISSERESV
mgnify:CR=1 FL=1